MNKSERGFTLLEVIVAFAIMALLLGAAFQTFSVGLRNVSAADGYTGAVMRGEQKLVSLGLTDRLYPGTTNGRFNDEYTWRMDIRTLAKDDGAVRGADTRQLYAVELTVFWGAGAQTRSIVLHTHRIGGWQN